MSADFVPEKVPRARVLVVDDEADIRLSVGRVLGLLGYEVDLAESGEQALAMAERTSYDVALLDIRLPGMDGIELMRRVADACPAMAVILLTGYAALDSAIAAVRSGAVDYLLKPASVRRIASAVATALARHRQATVPPTKVADQFLGAGPLTLDREQRLVTIGAGTGSDCRAASLTRSEATILSHLMVHPGVVVTCHELVGALGYTDGEEESRAIVRPHISRLRRKIEPDPASPRLILTVPGQGYVLKV